jgi:hypothetical protein
MLIQLHGDADGVRAVAIDVGDSQRTGRADVVEHQQAGARRDDVVVIVVDQQTADGDGHAVGDGDDPIRGDRVGQFGDVVGGVRISESVWRSALERPVASAGPIAVRVGIPAVCRRECLSRPED